MATDDAHPTRERRDLFSLAVLQIASGLFLIVTGFLVLRGDMKAMGWFAFHPPLVALALVSFLLGTVLHLPISPSRRLIAAICALCARSVGVTGESLANLGS